MLKIRCLQKANITVIYYPNRILDNNTMRLSFFRQQLTLRIQSLNF